MRPRTTAAGVKFSTCLVAFMIGTAIAHQVAAATVPIPQARGLAAIDKFETIPHEKAGIDSNSRYVKNLTRTTWNAEVFLQTLSGRDLVDIDVRWTGTEERYSGIFLPVGGTIHTLTQGTPTDWSAFIAAVGVLSGRYLDVEVGYFGADKRYSAIFLEDGDDYSYALRTTNTEVQFQAWLDQYLREGRAIVDFEAYTEPGGELRLAGVWVDDPNQPRTVLYYHLESGDISDLLRPLAGRLIDFERYWSPTHGAFRYAVITAMYPDGEWGHYRWLSSAELDSNHDIIADTNTHIIDIESWDSVGIPFYGAVWGDAPKSLLEVESIPSDSSPESLPPSLSTLLSDFESADQGTIGMYALNLRTQQSLAYRANEPFYLASSAKVAIHIKFWQEVQASRLDEDSTLNYTECDDCRDNWFVDNRLWPGFGVGDFGDDFTLERFDRGMMEVSDNGAASALVDDEAIGVSWDVTDLNEWLSGIAGVGRGWWPVTSIHDVDRTILWQGQVVEYPFDSSFFTIPGWAFEPYMRDETDTYGDLSDWLGNPPSLPRYDTTVGHARYYAMGLNSATPKAFSLLLEGLWEGRFLDASTTREAITRMTGPTALDNLLSSSVDVWAKSGTKLGASNPVSETAIIELGDDALAIAVITKDNTRSIGTIRSDFVAPIAQDVLRALMANLKTDLNNSHVIPFSIAAGEWFGVTARILNDGGGDCASAFDVTFYASDDVFVSEADHPIATVRVLPISAGTARNATFQGPFPATIPPGAYYVGWIIDASGGDVFGEVGEAVEGDNRSAIADPKLEVFAPNIFTDGFESGSTSAWSSVEGQP